MDYYWLMIGGVVGAFAVVVIVQTLARWKLDDILMELERDPHHEA